MGARAMNTWLKKSDSKRFNCFSGYRVPAARRAEMPETAGEPHRESARYRPQPHSAQGSSSLGSRNRDDVLALGQHPGQRDLGRRALMRCRDLLDGLQQIDVALEVFGIEPGLIPAAVLGQESIEVLDRRREKTATERRVSHVADTEFTAGGEDLLLARGSTASIRSRGPRSGEPSVRGGGLRTGFGKRKITHLARSTSFFIAPTVSSIGTVGSTRCRPYRSITSTPRRLSDASHAFAT